LFKRKTKNYKALVADVNLKGRMSGWEVARQIREIDPAFPIIYMSGAAADHLARVPNSIPLEKPFAPAQLVTAISNLLNTERRQRRAASVGGLFHLIANSGGAACWWPFDPPAIQPFGQSAPQHGRGSRGRGDTALKSTVSKIFLWKS
jgi:hypothetical protein